MLNLLPEPIQDKALVDALKGRLDWGEPALTIVDVRSRDDFNRCHITGAIPMPAKALIASAYASLELVRDIYVYGETDAQTTEAASQLRAAGYQHIAELVGGLAAWRTANYPIEGI